MAGRVRIAAVGDLHMREAVRGRFGSAFATLAEQADVLLLAGDLTESGRQAESEMLCDELASLPIPAVAVLGNHDHDHKRGGKLADMLRSIGVRVLDGEVTVLDIGKTRLGIAGVMGGAGGFPDYPPVWEGSEEHRARLVRGPVDAARLQAALELVRDCDLVVALTHFSPVADTLAGERVRIYPGLGCHDLAEAIDAGGADLAIHAHAHSGTECGLTAGGVPVRNVSYPVLRRPFTVYRL